jgi:hypothetical protein
MLGRIRRTSRADVGMALGLTGTSYLVWILVTGVCRHLAGLLGPTGLRLTFLSGGFITLHRQAWLVVDVLGLAWLLVGLTLILGASRQRWTISWAWLCAMGQSILAALLAVWSAVAMAAEIGRSATTAPASQVSWTSLSLTVALALLLWVTVLVWLLFENARLRRGPSLRDGLRTHVPG